jgi:hypothetical protein
VRLWKPVPETPCHKSCVCFVLAVEEIRYGFLHRCGWRTGRTDRKHELDNFSARMVQVNGEPGALIYRNGSLADVITLDMDESGKITNIFLVANPDKLPGQREI